MFIVTDGIIDLSSHTYQQDAEEQLARFNRKGITIKEVEEGYVLKTEEVTGA
jgi:hypothetical protein